MNKKNRLLNLLIITALFLGACNLPSGNQGEEVSLTAAAQTVEALLSATPLVSNTNTPLPIAVPATLTPIPLPVNTNTPAATATSNCNVAQFITDVTIPDGTVMLPGQGFVKKWRIKNAGSCAWNGFSMVFDSGESMGAAASKPIAALNPGQEVDLEMAFTAPMTPGNYRSYWRITTNANVLVPMVNGYQGKSFYVDIKVQAAATNTSAPAFAVTSVTFTGVGGCSTAFPAGFTATANITTNGPGNVTYQWIRNDPSVPSSQVLDFAAAGTQSVNVSWITSAVGVHGYNINIVSPNNQNFPPLGTLGISFTCP